MFKSIVTNLATLLVILLSLNACTSSRAGKDKEVSGPAAAVQTTTHQGVGKVTRLDPTVPSIEIDHEDIKDYMPAMKMDFRVKDKSLLNGLTVGDQIEFAIEDSVTGMQVIAIRKK